MEGVILKEEVEEEILKEEGVNLKEEVEGVN